MKQKHKKIMGLVLFVIVTIFIASSFALAWPNDNNSVFIEPQIMKELRSKNEKK